MCPSRPRSCSGEDAERISAPSNARDQSPAGHEPSGLFHFSRPNMLFPTFLKLKGRRVLLVGGGPVAAGKLRGLLEAGADVSVVAPAILLEIAAAPVNTDDARVPALGPRRRVVRGRRGAARGEPRGRGSGACSRHLRERRGRRRERERVCGRGRAAGGCDHRHLHRRRSAGAGWPGARGARDCCCPTTSISGWSALARRGATGWSERCRWPNAVRCCSRR